MRRSIARLIIFGLAIVPIGATLPPAQAAYPDQATYDLILKRYNTFLEDQGRWPCAYYGNLNTLRETGENKRSMSVLNIRDNVQGVVDRFVMVPLNFSDWLPIVPRKRHTTVLFWVAEAQTTIGKSNQQKTPC